MNIPQGMAYANWEFPIPYLDDLTFELEILSNVDQIPGRYYQLYDGHIGGVGSYFGLQTNLFNPSTGKFCGHGLIFSRWGTRDLLDTRVASDGWTESSGHEGDFVGVRSLMPWTAGKYICTLAVVDKDEHGIWYEFTVFDQKAKQKYSAGCLRFPMAKIKSGGGTWTEVYSVAKTESEVPETELRIISLVANKSNLQPIKCRVSYGNFFSSDAYVNNGVLILRSGHGVSRFHEAGEYDLS
jgi:hypothetical protein